MKNIQTKDEGFGKKTCQYFSHQKPYHKNEVNSTHKNQIEFCVKASTFSILKVEIVLLTQLGFEFRKKFQISQLKFKEKNIIPAKKIFLKENFLKKKIKEKIQKINKNIAECGKKFKENQKNKAEK